MLKKFGFKKSEPRESEARVRLQKELFAYNKCCDHGFPHKPTAMAYDPIMQVLAIATKSGGLKIVGQAGVEFSGQHEEDVHVSKIYFIPNQGRLITLCADNSLHLWQISDDEESASLSEVRSYQMEASKLKTLSACSVSGGRDCLLMGTEGGNIHSLQLPAFSLSDHIIYQDVVMQNVPDDFKVNPGAVEAIAPHPSDPNKILIGYNRGLIVLWDVTNANADQTYSASQQLESLTWHRDGTQFLSAHADGSYIIWSSTDSTKPKEQANTPYGPFPCRGINKVEWKNAKAEPFVVFSGGMPRPSYADRHTVSVMQGTNQVVFDFTSRVIDFTVLSTADMLEDPSSTEFDDPHSVIVLCEEELVAIDLKSEGWPTFRQPYLVSLHSSAITCSYHLASVPSAFWSKIVEAGDAQMSNQSSRDWPILGGRNNEATPAGHNLLLTGHEDGTVRFWDASTSAMKLIYKLGTAAIFGCDFGAADQSNVEAEDEWPPFRKVGTFDPYSDDPRLGIQKVSVCPVSETLVVAGTAGQVVVMQLEREERSTEIKAVTVNIVSDRDGFVWKGHEALNVVGGDFKQAAGFQSSAVMQLHPPAACTALSIHSEWMLVSAGTAHGFALFDYSQKKEIYTKCTLNPNDLTGTGDSAMSRRKSFKKSLRESFRRLRKNRSERSKKKGDKEEASPKGDKKGEGSPGKQSPMASSPEPGTRTIERQIEARPVDDSMASMVRYLYFTDTFLINGQGHTPTLWAGTNGGNVFICQIGVPANDKRDSEAVTCQLGKEIHLKHRAPVLSICVIDRNATPLQPGQDTQGEGAKTPDMTGAHQVVICSEEQFKVFSLPNLKPLNKFKLTAHEGSKVRKVAFVNFRSRADENYTENDLVVLTNSGDVHIFTIPHLRRQLKTPIINKENVSLYANDESGIVSSVFSCHGEGFFPASPSEYVRFSLSARTHVRSASSLEIKEDQRPPLPDPVPVVEDTEEAAQPEAAEQTEAASPTAGSEDGAAASPDGAGGEAGTPVSDPSSDQGAAEPSNESMAEALGLGDLTIDSKDMTIDSVKVHLSEESSSSKVEVVESRSSRTVVTRKVVSETMQDGQVVSSETTTTVTTADASGAAEAVTTE